MASRMQTGKRAKSGTVELQLHHKPYAEGGGGETVMWGPRAFCSTVPSVLECDMSMLSTTYDRRRRRRMTGRGAGQSQKMGSWTFVAAQLAAVDAVSQKPNPNPTPQTLGACAF